MDRKGIKRNLKKKWRMKDHQQGSEKKSMKVKNERGLERQQRER